jgi:hypothetical protein
VPLAYVLGIKNKIGSLGEDLQERHQVVGGDYEMKRLTVILAAAAMMFAAPAFAQQYDLVRAAA